MLVLDLPPQLHERVVCSISAAIKYEVPVNVVLAVAEKEGGRPGQWKRNTNGTDDVGPMQFNTAYLGELARYGITANDVAAAGCYSFDLAAWRLRMHIKRDDGDIWTRAANYHSRTPYYNAIYRADLIKRAVKWANWLEARFATYNILAPGTARASVISKPASPAQPTQPAVHPVAASSYVPRKLIISGQP